MNEFENNSPAKSHDVIDSGIGFVLSFLFFFLIFFIGMIVEIVMG